MSKVGFIVGRFQPVHLGHLDMIRQAKNYCDTLVILIGSSQESRTRKNPFTFEERAGYLRTALSRANLSNNTIIIPLPDQGIGNGVEWGKYVLETLRNCVGYADNLITFSGYEERRASWYSGLGVDDIMLDKYKNISATEVRNRLMRYYKSQNPLSLERTPDFNDILPQYLAYSKLDEMANIVADSFANDRTDSI